MIPKIIRRAPKPSEASHYEGTEPVHGLPARLPEGEALLWQGSPNWRQLAVRMFKLQWIAGYFALLLAWDGASIAWQSVDMQDGLQSMLQLAGLGLVALGIIAGFCYAVSRTTVYTLTSRRLVIRAGIAVPKTINIPYARLESAGLRMHPGTTGDIVLTPLASDRIAYLLLWPHAEAWRFSHARPMLRAVADAAGVARILGEALAAELEGGPVESEAAASSRSSAQGAHPAAVAA